MIGESNAWCVTDNDKYRHDRIATNRDGGDRHAAQRLH